MRLVVIIPAFNEEKTIRSVVLGIPKIISGVSEIETLVIDDGSSDKTAEQAKDAGAKVLSLKQNKGVGNAFSQGVEKALGLGADIVVNIDGDGQFNPKDIPAIITPILDDEADFVSCSRFKNENLIPKMPKLKIWGNRQVANIISYIAKQKFYDVSCGYRAYSKDVLINLNIKGKFTYTQESFLDLTFKGMRIVEIPLKVRGEREFGKSKVANNVASYAYRTSKIIFRTFRDYKPLKFFGSIGLVVFASGLALDGFLAYIYLRTGHFSPFKTLGFVGGFLNAMGVLIFVVALLADMLDRIRLNQEKILYYEKKRYIEENRAKSMYNLRD